MEPLWLQKNVVPLELKTKQNQATDHTVLLYVTVNSVYRVQQLSM